MKKSRKLVLLLCVLLIFGSTSTAFAAKEENEITKTYTFYPESKSNLKYDVPEKIDKDGKEYELKDVKYRINDKKSKEVTKSVTSTSKKYPKTLKDTVSGTEVTLVAETPQWKEVNAEGLIKTIEYKNESDIPQTIKDSKPSSDGTQIEITMQLAGTEALSRTEEFSAPAKFYSPYPDSTQYMFNGKIVELSVNSPEWGDYKADVKEYLGLNGNTYQISSGRWTSQPVKQGDQYVRTASFTGSKQVPFYRATYKETADTTRQYTADITYSYITAEAVAVYEPVTNITRIIAAGAGIVVLIAAVIALLVIISKKRKKKENDA